MADLEGLDVLIVDCQTTGASPALGSVLELGWGIARAEVTHAGSGDELAAPAAGGDEPTARIARGAGSWEARVEHLQVHWVALPEGHSVPFQVRRLTGFDEAEHTGALPPLEVWRRLRATMRGKAPMPAAIHFAKFELAFLRDWAAKFEPGADFPIDAVCVHAIACRLYPDLPRRSLRALAGFLGHGLDPARRCLGHVEATAFIWQKLRRELTARGVKTWGELGAWLAAPAPPRSRKRRYPLPSARYRALPDEPGVYRFLRSNGDVLYVGKAASLRKRVASHFTAGASTTERALEMLTQVHDVLVSPTGTALEAALSENESIKALCPPYNVQLLAADPRTWFSSETFEATASTPDDVHRLGPLPSTFSVRGLGVLVRLASGQASTPALRARAVGAPDRWAPDEAVFAAGLAIFAERHWAGARPIDARRAVMAAARKLILLGRADPAGEDAGASEDTGTSAAEARLWDPERVVRHLERNAAQGYQLLRRARWLCFLHDSAVAFCEAPRERHRLLLVRDGTVTEARDWEAGAALPAPPAARPLRERQAAFDRAKYDRLRILTTELKRVRRDGGAVEVRVGRGRLLAGRALDQLLLWV